jgi:hypothetical protein
MCFMPPASSSFDFAIQQQASLNSLSTLIDSTSIGQTSTTLRGATMMENLLSLPSIPPLSAVSVMQLLLLVYMAVEVVFYVVFHYHLIPKANIPIPPEPYRDYGDSGERHLHLYRIFHRVRKSAQQSNVCVREALADFLLSWFDEAPVEQGGEPKVKLTPTAKARLLERSKSFPCPYKGEPAPPAILLRGLSNATGYSSSSSSTSRPSSEDGSVNEDLDDSGDDIGDDLFDHHQVSTSSSSPVPENKGKWMMEGLWQENVSVFFAWAMFGKSHAELLEWEVEELELCKNMMENEFDLVFPHNLHNLSPALTCVRGPKASPQPPCPHGRQPVLDPRLLNVESVRSMHRPLVVYLGVMMMKWMGEMFLRLLGFQRLVLNGVVTWYRPASSSSSSSSSSSLSSPPSSGAGQDNDQQQLQPLLFFHGIAPGGFVFYLPMLFAGLVKGDAQRAMAIFLNPSITYDMNFQGITEVQMVAAVEEFVDKYLDQGRKQRQQQQFAVAGHSFGSVPITWLIHSSLRNRIGQILLLDPVTILLSDSAIVGNFLYCKSWNYTRILTSSELFTEHYLRRQFAWYNADLWLEDLPPHVPVTICLSGSDQIVDAPAVRKLILQHKQEHSEKNNNNNNKEKTNDSINLIYWEGAAHAFCVALPFKWPEMRKVLLEQELASLQQRRQE